MSSITKTTNYRRFKLNMNVRKAEDSLRKAARRAAEAGWSIHPPEFELTNEMLVLHLALDSKFWQALGTAERWPEWESHQQEFIDYLADRGDADSFFAHVLK